MGLCPFGFLDSKFQLSEPQFCHIPSVLGSSCPPSFIQKSIWTSGIDPTVEKGDFIKSILGSERTTDDVGPPKIWSNGRALMISMEEE